MTRLHPNRYGYLRCRTEDPSNLVAVRFLVSSCGSAVVTLISIAFERRPLFISCTRDRGWRTPLRRNHAKKSQIGVMHLLQRRIFHRWGPQLQLALEVLSQDERHDHFEPSDTTPYLDSLADRPPQDFRNQVWLRPGC